MAEALVKAFKRDYVYVNDLPYADAVVAQLQAWFGDYNDVQTHQGLKMMSPRQFRQTQEIKGTSTHPHVPIAAYNSNADAVSFQVAVKNQSTAV